MAIRVGVVVAKDPCPIGVTVIVGVRVGKTGGLGAERVGLLATVGIPAGSVAVGIAEPPGGVGEFSTIGVPVEITVGMAVPFASGVTVIVPVMVTVPDNSIVPEIVGVHGIIVGGGGACVGVGTSVSVGGGMVVAVLVAVATAASGVG